MKHDVDGGARHISDWSQWTVEHMWQVLRNEDPERTARHSGAWYDVMDACARHRDRLRAFRDQLVQRWSGPAADAYLAKLDQLIGGLDETTEAAFNTYRALSTMADAVTAARQQMAPLYGQWQRYEQEERDARDQWWLVQAIRGNPVTPDEREALNRPARAIMNTASDAIFQSYLTMTPAPPYDFVPVAGPVTRIGPDGSSSGLDVPPVAPLRPHTHPSTPPPFPSSSASQLPTLDGGVSSSGPTTVSLPPLTNQTSRQPVIPPVIDSMNSPPAAVPLSVPPATNLPRTGIANGTGAGSNPSQRGYSLGSSPIVPPPVIGARTGGLGWAPMSAGSRGTAPNPVGGVIGGLRSTSHRRNSDRRPSQPQDFGMFAVDTSDAVPPVLEPDEEPPYFEPGPAIGITR